MSLTFGTQLFKFLMVSLKIGVTYERVSVGLTDRRKTAKI